MGNSWVTFIVKLPYLKTANETNNTPSRNFISVTPKEPLNIILGKIIGKGSFSLVYKGKYNNNTNVAIKVETLSNSFINREVHILKKFIEIPHKNIINMINYHKVKNNDNIKQYIIMDYYKNTIIDLCNNKNLETLQSHQLMLG